MAAEIDRNIYSLRLALSYKERLRQQQQQRVDDIQRPRNSASR